MYQKNVSVSVDNKPFLAKLCSVDGIYINNNKSEIKTNLRVFGINSTKGSVMLSNRHEHTIVTINSEFLLQFLISDNTTHDSVEEFARKVDLHNIVTTQLHDAVDLRKKQGISLAEYIQTK